MPVPYTFGTATASIPLSQLDSNFATAITIGNTAVQLGNTVTTLNNMTLANVTISSGNVTITNVSVTTANVSGTANVSTMVIIGNESVGGNTTVTGNISANNATLTTNLTLSGGTANGVAYLNTSKALTTGTGFVFDGTNVGIGTSSPSKKVEVYATANSLQIESIVRNDQPGSGVAAIGFNVSSGAASETTSTKAGIGLVRQSAYGVGSLCFYNNGTSSAGDFTTSDERMRIDSSGNLLVGATAQIGVEKLGVTSGTANATQYTTIATKGGSGLYVNQQQTTSVSTTATVILATPNYCTFCLVHGSDGTNRFSDVVLMSIGTGTVNVISSLTASGTPAARTYSQASSTFKLAMASGTYTVQVSALTMNS